MDNFPLYDTLICDLPSKDLTLKQKKDFLTKIETIDLQGAELVYTLIRAYQIYDLNDNPTVSLPFEGKMLNENSDLEFNISKFPIKLRQLLYKFLHVHFKAMKEKVVSHKE